MRDSEHLRHVAQKASKSSLLVYLYTVELIDHLKRKGLAEEQILRRLQHFHKLPRKMDKIKELYPDVFAFLEKVINTAKDLLGRGEAL